MLTRLSFSVSGLCGAVKSPTTNDHSLGSVRPVFVPGFNRDAYDVSHLTVTVAAILKETTCSLLRKCLG